MTGIVPKLLGLLDEADPATPHPVSPGGPYVVKEMVRINHLRNCVLCHAVSVSDEDKVRGFVPSTNQPVPPAFTREYYSPKHEGHFVRADITYLQQDFSVPLTVPDPGLWPAAQRFDFMVRERPALSEEIRGAADKAGVMSSQQQAVAFALRELTGLDPGPAAEDWKRCYFKTSMPRRIVNGLREAAGIVVTDKGELYIADRGANALLKMETGGQCIAIGTQAAEWTGLALDRKGRLIAGQGKGEVVAINFESGDIKPLAPTRLEMAFRKPSFLALDRQGGTYVSDPNAGAKGRVFYISAQGGVSRLDVDIAQPRGLALAPDDKTLYLTTQAPMPCTPIRWRAPAFPARAGPSASSIATHTTSSWVAME